MQARSAARLLRVAAGLLGQVVGTARQIPLKGRQHLPHRAYRPLLKLFSELETLHGKEKGHSPLWCQRADWATGLGLLPRRVTHRQVKGIRALQNQWDGKNSSLAGLQGFSSFGPASLEARPEMRIRGHRLIKKGACGQQGGDREAASPAFVANQPCDLQQVALPLEASVSIYVK